MFYTVAGATVQTTRVSGPINTLTSLAEVSIWVMNTSTFQFQVDTKIEFEGPITMTPQWWSLGLRER